MEDFGKERLSIKAYRLSEVSGNDWDKLLPKYKEYIGGWQVTPKISWLLSILCLLLIFSNLYYPWFPMIAFVVFWGLNQKVSKLDGQIEGFQDGYELGKTDGVCRGLGIKKTEQDELLKKARELIVEFKVESGDRNLELGEEFKKEA